VRALAVAAVALLSPAPAAGRGVGQTSRASASPHRSDQTAHRAARPRAAGAGVGLLQPRPANTALDEIKLALQVKPDMPRPSTCAG
jgi:hypothetical protein